MKSRYLLLLILLLSGSCVELRWEKRHYRRGFYFESDREIHTVQPEHVQPVSPPLHPVKPLSNPKPVIVPEIAEHDTLRREKRRKAGSFSDSIRHLPVDQPNRKARAASALAGSGQLSAMTAFILALCGVMTVAFAFLALAGVLYLLALFFGKRALNEIAEKPEPGKRMAEKAIAVSAAMLVLGAGLWLLSLLVRLAG